MADFVKEKLLRTIFIAGCALFLGMTAITFCHAIGRYAFEMPIKGQAEIVTYMQFAAIALLSPYAVLKGCHVGIDLLVNKLPRKAKGVCGLCTDAILLFFFSAYGVKCFEFAGKLYEQGRTTYTLKIQTYPFFYLLGVMLVLTAFTVVFLVMDHVKSMREPEGGATV